VSSVSIHLAQLFPFPTSPVLAHRNRSIYWTNFKPRPFQDFFNTFPFPGSSPSLSRQRRHGLIDAKLCPSVPASDRLPNLLRLWQRTGELPQVQTTVPAHLQVWKHQLEPHCDYSHQEGLVYPFGGHSTAEEQFEWCVWIEVC